MVEQHSHTTSDSLNEYMRTHRDGRCAPLVSCIECHDGFCISVQGHYGAYSYPREDGADYYHEVECGYPSAPVPQLVEWKDGEKVSDQTDMECVYGYVPVDVVAKLLNDHGGIKGPKAFPEKTDARPDEVAVSHTKMDSRREIAGYLAHLAGCLRAALGNDQAVNMRATREDAKYVQHAADLLSDDEGVNRE